MNLKVPVLVSKTDTFSVQNRHFWKLKLAVLQYTGYQVVMKALKIDAEKQVLKLCLGLRPVHEEQLFGSTGKGGVKPVDIVRREHIVGHVALVNIYVRPLAALCLVAGYGIGELNLQGVVVRVGTQTLHAVGTARLVGIILKYGVEELFALLVRKGRSLG